MAGLLTGVLFPQIRWEATPTGTGTGGAGAGALGCQLRRGPRATACASSPVSRSACGEARAPRGPRLAVDWGCPPKAPQLAGRLGQTTLPRVEFILRAWGWGSWAAGVGAPWAAGAGSPRAARGGALTGSWGWGLCGQLGWGPISSWGWGSGRSSCCSGLSSRRESCWGSPSETEFRPNLSRTRPRGAQHGQLRAQH